MNNAASVAYMAGYYSVYLVAFGVATGLGFYLARKDQSRRFIWWPVIAIAVLLMGTLLFPLMERATSTVEQANVKPAMIEMRVESAVGRDVSGQNIVFTPEMVRAHEALVRNRFISELRSKGIPASDAETAIVVSELLSIGKEKVIRTKSDLPGTVSVWDFAGIKNGKEINVLCLQEGGSNLVYENSPCEKKVQEVFGTSSIELVK